MATFNELKNRVVNHLNYPNHIQIRSSDIILYPGPNELRLYWGQDLLQDSPIEMSASFNGIEIPIIIIKTLYNQVLLSVNLPEEDGIFEFIVCGQCIDNGGSTCKNVFSSEVINIQNPAAPKFIQEPTISSSVYTKSIISASGRLVTTDSTVNFYLGTDPDNRSVQMYKKSEDIGQVFLSLDNELPYKVEGNSLIIFIYSLSDEFYSNYSNYFSEDFINKKIINQRYELTIKEIYNQTLFLVEPFFIDDESGNSVFISLLTTNSEIQYNYKESSPVITPWKIDNLFVKISNTSTYHSVPSNISINKIYDDGTVYKIGDYQVERYNWGKHFYDERNVVRPVTYPVNYIGNLFNPDQVLLDNIWSKNYGGIAITNNGGLYNSLTISPDSEIFTVSYQNTSNLIYLSPINCYQNKFYKISFRYWTKSEGTLQFYFEDSSTNTSVLIFEIITDGKSGECYWEYMFDSTAYHGLDMKEIKLNWNGTSEISLSNLDIIEEYELGPTYWINTPLTENIRGEEYNLSYTFTGPQKQSLNKFDNGTSNTGNPTYIFGENNTVLGDLWVNDGYPTRGVQIHSDAASSWIGSVGYRGRNVAQTQGVGGWLIWSGAVGNPYNPNDNPHYKGVGMELHAGMNSGALRFFTDPETNTGILEVTGSIYAENGYFSGELQATSGRIAGLYIKDKYLQNDTDFYNSTLMVGSDSTMWTTPSPSERIKYLHSLSPVSTLSHNRAIHTNPLTSTLYSNTGGLTGGLLVNITGSAANSFLENNISLHITSGSTSGTWTVHTWDLQNCDVIHISTGLRRMWTGEYSPDYPQSVELKIDFWNNTTPIDSQILHIKNVDPIKGIDFTFSNYSKSIIVPQGANRFSYEYIFYKGILGDYIVDDIFDCQYKIVTMDITGEKAYVEISPSGFLYRLSDEKYIKLGKDSFDIKGTQLEADTITSEDQIMIGPNQSTSWDKNIGLLNIRQTDTTPSSSIFTSFDIYRAQNWIGLQGAYNWNIENDQLEKYAWYNNGSKIMNYYDNSLYVSSSIFSRHQLGGLTNSGEVLTFSRTVTAAGGITVLPTIVTSSGGVVTIHGGAARLYSNPNYSSFIDRYELPATSSFTLTNNAINYIVVKKSGNSAIYAIETSVSLINESDVFPVLTAYRENDNIYYINWDSLGRGLPNRLHQRLVKTERFAREYGLMIGTIQDGTDYYLTLTGGRTWIGVVNHDLNNIDSSINNIRLYYHTSATDWASTTINILNINQYDKIDSATYGLNTLGSNKYGVSWIFRIITDQESTLSEKVAIVLGNKSNMNSIDEAMNDGMPDIPPLLSVMAVPVGKIIYKNEATPIILSVLSLWDAGGSAGSSSTINIHNSLSGLDGGAPGEYFHLTLSDYNSIANSTGTGDFVRETSPTIQTSLNVNGILTATSISETSDERLKENIVDLESQLFNIYKLFPKRFNFISNINKQEIGLIAQEVMKIYPELVIQNGEYYSIEYSKLTTILISGMKELIDENEKLKNRIENIEISLKVLSDLIREKQ